MTIETITALTVTISGAVEKTNIKEYEQGIKEFIGGINRNPETDSDFAQAEADIKTLQSAEKGIAKVKDAALNSTSSIREFFEMVDGLSSTMRDCRLSLSRLVKSKKDSIKLQVIIEANEKFSAHMRRVNGLYEDVSIHVPHSFDPKDAIKGRKTIKGMSDAVEDAMKDAMLDYSEMAASAAEDAREAKRAEEERVENMRQEAIKAERERAEMEIKRAKEKAEADAKRELEAKMEAERKEVIPTEASEHQEPAELGLEDVMAVVEMLSDASLLFSTGNVAKAIETTKLALSLMERA